MASTHNTSAAVPQDDVMDIDNELPAEIRRPLSLLSSTRDNRFSILDPTIRRTIFDNHLDPANQTPFVTHPREVREIPIEVKDSNQSNPQGDHVPTIEDVTGTVQAHGPDVHGTVIINDEDDDDTPPPRTAYQDEQKHTLDRNAGPSAPEFENLPDYSNDIEEEMIRAAIEASKREAEEKYPNHNLGRQIVCFYLDGFLMLCYTECLISIYFALGAGF